MKRNLHLFEAFGIELEYMIVDKDSLSVLPITDEIIRTKAGEYTNEVRVNGMDWSNELVLHVLELKTPKPAATLDDVPSLFQESVKEINSILENMNGRLMPTAMHPWMDPLQEMKLWPHDNSPIYDSYNRIFDCRGHGWANLQSMHLNLPFGNDKEFGRLHAAIRLILPILPALAASSPIAEGKKADFMDYRLEVYRHNQAKVPAIAGKVIPEAVFSKKDYDTHIFQPLYKDISPLDPEGILQEEWLNSRGAIGRWDRHAIEIRLLDIQECPQADIAIASLIIQVLKMVVNEHWLPYEDQKHYSEDDLAYILLDCIRKAENAEIHDKNYLRAFGIEQCPVSAKELWQHLYNEAGKNGADKSLLKPVNTILKEGTLSSRILKATGNETRPERLKEIYTELCNCLEKGKMFIP